jgi:hypothetical protein
MTDAAELSAEELRIEQAADQARRVLNGEHDLSGARKHLSQLLREATLEAPLHSLVIAFLLGVLFARPR